MDPTLIVPAGVAAAVVASGAMLVQIALLWRLVRLQRLVDRFEAKMAQLGEALTLLTETTEVGFRAVAAELSRAQAPDRAPAARATNRRVAAAARRGRTIPQIAVDEQVSEGEVRLRLHLGTHPGRATAHDAPSRQESSDAPLRP